MPRDVHLFLDDILESIDTIFDYTKEIYSLNEFLEPNRAILRDAVIKNIITIGEAAKAVMKQISENISDFDIELWSGLAKLKDIMVH